jgi:hypothetical protein
MHASGSAPRALLLLLAACVAEVYVDATFCYVGVSDQRRYNTSTKAVECPPAIYGSNAACAYACARHKQDKTDVCTFLCIPGQHCDGSSGRIHPVSEVSPGLFLPGCPRQENFEAVDTADATYECEAQCCTKDRCNENGAQRIHAWPVLAALGSHILTVFILTSAFATA